MPEVLPGGAANRRPAADVPSASVVPERDTRAAVLSGNLGARRGARRQSQLGADATSSAGGPPTDSSSCKGVRQVQVGAFPGCHGAPNAPRLWCAQRVVAALNQNGTVGTNPLRSVFQPLESRPAQTLGEEYVRGLPPAAALQLPFPFLEHRWGQPDGIDRRRVPGARGRRRVVVGGRHALIAG
jgi:hypothetical protein